MSNGVGRQRGVGKKWWGVWWGGRRVWAILTVGRGRMIIMMKMLGGGLPKRKQ